MTTEELNIKVEDFKHKIQNMVIEFKKETGFSISEIKPTIIDASTLCGNDYLAGTITIQLIL